MTTLNDLKGYSDNEAYTVRVGELRALLADGGKGEAVAGDIRTVNMGDLVEFHHPQYGVGFFATEDCFTAPQAECAPRDSNESAYQRGYLDGMAKGRRDAQIDAAECAPRAKYDSSIQPGSPLFDGAEAYQAHLEASAERAECAPRAAVELIIQKHLDKYDRKRECSNVACAQYNAVQAMAADLVSDPQAECAPRANRDALYRKALAMGDAPDTIGPDTHAHNFEVEPSSGIELCTYCHMSRLAAKKSECAPREAQPEKNHIETMVHNSKIIQALHVARYALVTHSGCRVICEGVSRTMDFEPELNQVDEVMTMLGVDLTEPLPAPVEWDSKEIDDE